MMYSILYTLCVCVYIYIYGCALHVIYTCLYIYIVCTVIYCTVWIHAMSSFSLSNNQLSSSQPGHALHSLLRPRSGIRQSLTIETYRPSSHPPIALPRRHRSCPQTSSHHQVVAALLLQKNGMLHSSTFSVFICFPSSQSHFYVACQTCSPKSTASSIYLTTKGKDRPSLRMHTWFFPPGHMFQQQSWTSNRTCNKTNSAKASKSTRIRTDPRGIRETWSPVKSYLEFLVWIQVVSTWLSWFNAPGWDQRQ